MTSLVRCFSLVVLAGCAADGSAVAFHRGRLDAQVVAPEPTPDAGADAQVNVLPEPPPQAPPGSEVGRLAGFSQAHNAARARVQAVPPLPLLVWSSELALVAQAYADTLAEGCLDTLMHSAPESRHRWGENLASYGIMGGSGLEPNGTPAEVVALWESELGCYTFGPFASGTNETCSADCAKYGGCGHYTQLVWRATRRFGCGSADCRQGDWRKTYWVCNYDPSGNLRGQFPY